jgi:hypothetical protein
VFSESCNLVGTSRLVDTYQVKLVDTNQIIYLSQATQQDVMSASNTLKCDWLNFWSNLDSDCEAIIKLESQGIVQGLIHIALYPYPPADDRPEYLEIIALEATQRPHRLVQPVGLYLIWYATKTSIDSDCTGNDDGSIVELDSLESAIDYYKNQVRMEGKGWVTLGPYEDGYAFRFSKEQAVKFCNRIEQRYGIPEPI